MARPVVAIIGTGGTISSVATDPINYIDYAETGRRLSVEEVLVTMPELARFADLVPLPAEPVSSSAIGPKQWLSLRKTILDAVAARPEIAGIVLLHGTGTMEETAYFLSLTLPTDRPVVLAGAQRPLNAISSDALANAVNAVRVAGDESARGRGVMVVMNDEIHVARAVTKGSTMRVHAFHSGAYGLIGTADPDLITFAAPASVSLDARPAFDVEGLTDLPRVDICFSYAGSDGSAIRAFRGSGARGIISAGFAPGVATVLERAALLEASRVGITVVQASRVGEGRVATRSWFRNHGWIAAGAHNAQKARILLMLGLTTTSDIEALQASFDEL